MVLLLPFLGALFGLAHFWGHDYLYVGAALCYLLFFLLLPGALLTSLFMKLQPPHRAGFLACSVILGTFICLIDYFSSVRLQTRFGLGILGSYLIFGLGCIYRGRENSRLLATDIRKILKTQFPQKLATSAVLGAALILYGVLITWRINPESWSQGEIFYNVDMGWHMAMSNMLARDFPIRIPNFYESYYYSYHCLPHIISAHVSRIFSLHPSLAYLQTLPIFVTFLITAGFATLLISNGITGIAVFSTFFASTFIGVLPFRRYTEHIFIAEGYPFSYGFLLLSLCILTPHIKISKLSFFQCMCLGLGCSFTIISKGSMGPFLVSSLLGLFCLDCLFLPKEILRIRSCIKLFMVVAIAVAIYVYFFQHSNHVGSIWGGHNIRSLLKQSPNFLFLIPIFAAALFMPFFAPLRRLSMFLSLYVLGGMLAFAKADVSGNQPAFLVSAIAAQLIIVTIFLAWIITYCRSQKIKWFTVCLLFFLPFLSDTPLIKILAFYDRDRFGALAKDVLMDKDLFEVTQFLREHSEKNAMLIHTIGTDSDDRVERSTEQDGMLYMHNVQMVTPFSERVSYLGYMPRDSVHGYGPIMHALGGLEKLKNAEELVERIFDPALGEIKLESLVDLHLPIYVVCTKEQYEFFSQDFSAKLTLAFEKGEYQAFKINL